MTSDSKHYYLFSRAKAFRDVLKEHDLDGYLLTHLSDLYYFTDYKMEGYYAFMGKEESWLFLPNLLYEQAKAVTQGFHCIEGKFFEELKKIIAAKKMKKLGFDPAQLPYSFGLALTKLGFKPVPDLVMKLRAIKDALEMKRLRAANHLAWEGSEYVRKKLLKVGRTEKAVSADLAHFFNTKGDGIAFDLIIAGGPNGAFPHHMTSNYKLKSGEAVICDIGATWEGYRSDLTRTFPLGKMSAAFTKVFNIVLKSQTDGIEALKPGVTAGGIDLICRKVIEKSGFGKTFVHSTGHGVGIDIHEHPRLGPGAKDKLEAGMVVTVEPGIYLPGKFGVRIEDTLWITQNGSERLTK